jgi:hypothetical protein
VLGLVPPWVGSSGWTTTAPRPPVVVLGHRFFERRFGGDPGVVGRAVSVNNHPMTVVGVAPPGFDGIEVGASVDVYVPLAMQLEVQPTWGGQLGEWRSRWLTSMARLRDGVSREEAAAAANVVYRQLLQRTSPPMTRRKPEDASG